MTDHQILFDSIAMLQDKDEGPGLKALINLFKETKDYEIKNNTSIILFYYFFWTDQFEEIKNLGLLEFFKLNPTFIDLVHLGLKKQKEVNYINDSQVLPMTYNEISTPLIDIMIDHKKHTFWLDPSVALSSISMDFIENNDLKDCIEVVSHDDNYEQAYLLVNHFELANLEIKNQSFLVLPSEYSQVEISDQEDPIKIQGVIGMDLIKYLDFTIHFEKETYTLKKPQKDEGKKKNILFDNFLLAKVDYKEKEVIVGLDPLVDQTFMSENFYEENEMEYKTGNIQSEGPGGYEVIQANYVDALTLGINGLAFELENIWNVAQLMTDIYQIDGIIGGDVLRRTTLHFDLLNRHFCVE